jgi:hypothetical protein
VVWGDILRWDSLLFKLSLVAFLALLLAHPGAARGNTTSGIYPGTVKDVCVGDTIFVGETGLNLTPLTPFARGEVTRLEKYQNDDPAGTQENTIHVKDSRNFDVPSTSVYGTYFPVMDKKVLRAYPIQIQPAIPKYPQNVVITSGSDWVTANGMETAILTVTVTDSGNNPISGADMVMRASTPWAVRDTVLKTDGSGKAQTVFSPTTRSGNAVITASATVQGVTTAPVTTSLIQKVDADRPSSILPIYLGAATVGSPVDVTVLVRDRYGNAVTSLRSVKNVTFLTSMTGTAYFDDGTGDRLMEVSLSLNDTGFAGVTYFLSTRQGNNFISILPPDPLGVSLINIVGVGNSIPYSISQSVTPPGNPPFILADGSSQATLDYYLLDKWGNPAADQAIQIVTSAGENRIFYANQEGHVTVLYGPKLSAGFYSITAGAVGNSSVRISQTLQFGSLDPTDMLLTASPQTMASLDVNPVMAGRVMAKVIDVRGNPVKGETVTFSIENSTHGTYNLTQDPSIGSGGVTTAQMGAPVPVITDENGQAILNYYPGAFPKPGTVGWSETAQGITTVNASWEGPAGTVFRSIDLSYKNYPFLSVYTEVNPKTVETGTLVDVSVRLKGDGWALQPKPIDVVLCTDRSGTMLYNESIDPMPEGKLVIESMNDRMVDAMNASRTFVNKTSGQDRIGLVTFGAVSNVSGLALLNRTGNAAVDKYLSSDAWRVGRDYACTVKDKTCSATNSKDQTNQMPDILKLYPGHNLTGRYYRVNGVPVPAYVDSPLSYDKTQVITAINNIVPAGGTSMRRGIYDSVKLILTDPETLAGSRDGSVKAVVLLTDGKWNVGGDPRGIVELPGFDIEGYTELEKAPIGNSRGSVISWAKANNIKIFTIALLGKDSDLPNQEELKAYADETGGKPYVAASSQNLTNIYMDIAGVLREEASVETKVNLDFTSIEVNSTYNLNGKDVLKYEPLGPKRSTYIMPPSGIGELKDSSRDWENNQSFLFPAGTIKVNEEWVVNFTLRVLSEGNIKILSSRNSKVTFVGTEGTVGIPDTFITSVPHGIEKGPEDVGFEIQDLRRTNSETDRVVATMSWHPYYTGKDGNITWEIWLIPPYAGAEQYRETFQADRGVDPIYPLSIVGLQAGAYTFKVKGHVSDANDKNATRAFLIPEPQAAAQIKIA